MFGFRNFEYSSEGLRILFLFQVLYKKNNLFHTIPLLLPINVFIFFSPNNEQTQFLSNEIVPQNGFHKK